MRSKINKSLNYFVKHMAVYGNATSSHVFHFTYFTIIIKVMIIFIYLLLNEKKKNGTSAIIMNL